MKKFFSHQKKEKNHEILFDDLIWFNILSFLTFSEKISKSIICRQLKNLNYSKIKIKKIISFKINCKYLDNLQVSVQNEEKIFFLAMNPKIKNSMNEFSKLGVSIEKISFKKNIWEKQFLIEIPTSHISFNQNQNESSLDNRKLELFCEENIQSTFEYRNSFISQKKFESPKEQTIVDKFVNQLKKSKKKNQLKEEEEAEIDFNNLGILPEEEDLDENAYEFLNEDLPNLCLPESPPPVLPVQYLTDKHKKLNYFATKYSQEDLEILPEEEDFDFIDIPKIYFPKLKLNENRKKLMNEEDEDLTELGILPIFNHSYDSIEFQNHPIRSYKEWKFFSKKNSFSLKENEIQIKKSIKILDLNTFEIKDKIKSNSNFKQKNEELSFKKNNVEYKIQHQFSKNFQLSILEECSNNYGIKIHYIPILNEIGCYIHPDSFMIVENFVNFLIFQFKNDFEGEIQLISLFIE